EECRFALQVEAFRGWLAAGAPADDAQRREVQTCSGRLGRSTRGRSCPRPGGAGTFCCSSACRSCGPAPAARRIGARCSRKPGASTRRASRVRSCVICARRRTPGASRTTAQPASTCAAPWPRAPCRYGHRSASRSPIPSARFLLVHTHSDCATERVAMRVAVILSTYNWPHALELSLWGYAVQTWPDLQVVAADGGAGPETRATSDRVRAQSGMDIVHVWHTDRGFRKNEILNRAILRTDCEY